MIACCSSGVSNCCEVEVEKEELALEIEVVPVVVATILDVVEEILN